MKYIAILKHTALVWSRIFNMYLCNIMFVSVYRKHRNNVGPSKPISQPRRNIVGCRIQHGWKEGSGPVTQWKGTVLDQVPVNPSLYLIKYDGFDCVYGLELHKDERVSALEVLPDRVGKFGVFLLNSHTYKLTFTIKCSPLISPDLPQDNIWPRKCY